jgi:hypothetical protein
MSNKPTGFFHRLLFISTVLVLIPVFALPALAVKARFADGPSVVFSGGPLIAGEMVTGPEPDWSFVRDVREFELQLVNPAKSRRLWIVEVEGKLYLNSNYMGGLREILWKRWPAQAERDGRAIMRIDGKRYVRTLVRIKAGPIVEAVTTAFTRKYGVEMTPAEVEAEELWLFELAPPNSITNGGST